MIDSIYYHIYQCGRFKYRNSYGGAVAGGGGGVNSHGPYQFWKFYGFEIKLRSIDLEPQN